MKSRVLIHPGFHKTGTTSLQFWANVHRDLLAPNLRILLKEELRDATRISQRYSIAPEEFRLTAFANAFSAGLNLLDPSDLRPVLISSEALAGQIPGRKNIMAYDAAPVLIDTAVAKVKKWGGDDIPVTIWFTTRDAENWKRSAYWQNVRTTRVTEDFETYRPRLERAAQLDKIVSLTRSRLGGRAQVFSTRLEASTEWPLGLLGAALDLLDVPTDGIPPLDRQNVQPSNAAERLLELNRSDMDDKTLSETKRKLLQKYRKAARARNASADDKTA